MKCSPLWIVLAIFVAATSFTLADTTFSVINTNNSGAGSLADAITNCNNTPGDDTITFDIPGSGPHLITLTSDLPAITSNIVFLNDRAGDEAVVVRCPSDARRTIFSVNAGTTVTFAGLTIQTGRVAVDMSNASVTVRNCYVRDQSSAAIQSSASSSGVATLMVINSTIANNSSGITGLADSGGVMHTTLMNSTMDNNNTPDDYGGSAFDIEDGSNGASTLLLVNSTVTRNSSQTHGATVLTISTSIQTLNTIFVHAGSGVNFVLDGSSSLTSLGHNLSDLPEGGDLGTGPGGSFGATGDKRNTNPQLGPLQSNGGLTFTRAVAAGTPPADAGDDAVLSSPYNLTTDQRGAPRKAGTHVDIGAYEREVLPQAGPGFVVTTTDDHDDGVCGAFDCTLREAVNAANANADANTLTFAPGVTGTIQQSVTGGLPIAHPLTIAGPGAQSLRINGNYTNRAFLIQAGAGNVSILDLTIAYTLASSNTFPDNCGGAIYNAASLTLTRCSFDTNQASLLGGAIYNDGQNGNASLTMTDCSIVNGVARASGGAIFNAGYTGHATASLTNCTLLGNDATQYGGAIYNDGTQNGNAALTLTNCTIAYNSSDSNVGGNINNDGMNSDSSGIATVILRNDIFQKSTTANKGANLLNDGGTLTSQGHNLSDDPAGGDASTAPGGYLNATGDKRNTDPLLGLFGLNGGSTYCMALTAGSPAINAGDDNYAPGHDQRGMLRNGVSDIGAYEFDAIDPATITGITKIARNGTNIVITFQGVAGKTFRLERNSRPTGGGWQSIAGVNDAKPASTGPAQFTDPNAISLGTAFYRVRYIPQ